jgi:heme-degrading monooxygenase HmoA
MLSILWAYRVRPDRIADFERAYGPAGVWAGLFREHAGFAGTELFRAAGNDARYLTIDRWSSREAYERFLGEASDRYAEIDRSCGELTEREEHLGDIEMKP